MKKIIALILAGVGLFTAHAQNITTIEYSIDQDNGFDNGTQVTVAPGPDGTFNFLANTTGLSRGYHTLYFRTKDSDEKWSHTSYRTIEVLDDITANLVTQLEFFDNNLGAVGAGNISTINNPQQDAAITTNFPYSGLTAGNITMYVRAKDSKEQWSLPAWKTFTIVKQNDPPISVKDIAGADFAIFPNPASNELTLHFATALATEVQVRMTDIKGTQVGYWLSKQQETTLDVQQLATGTYFLQINYNNQVVNEKVSIIK